ncbi:hypothetical protein [Streptomyces halobius]|uniref:Transcriptional regulator n=1 Tax=Streptomyces halobius TaxID=2879846 RepID=A0ABY4MIM5_9ACTN|nr:hypothetical protein [Streptomyces halobius]UQA97413.1 hypothetical protein K9S39_41110 [Streptomyces halobius]
MVQKEPAAVRERAVRHPLAVVRTAAGHSQHVYARLVAKTHAALGFGRMAARREKVARWESGRIVPELTAQLAIAHMHQVPRDDVLCDEWPMWLYKAASDGAPSAWPWTSGGTAEALRSASRPTPAVGRGLFTASGETVARLIRAWPHTADPPPPPPAAPPASPRGVAALAALESRVAALESMICHLGPGALVPLARSEAELIATLLDDAAFDDEARTRLRLLGARASAVCSWVWLLGDRAAGERCFLTAVRAAIDARAPRLAATLLAHLAYAHCETDGARGALALVDAAHGLAHRPRRPPAPLHALLHLRRAHAQARLGETTESGRALDIAEAAMDVATDRADEPIPAWLLAGTMLRMSAGVVHLALGRPTKALDRFAPLLDAATADVQSPGIAVLYLPHAVRAQLAVGDVETAVGSGERVVALLGGAPAEALERLRHAFAPHRDVPAARAFLEHLEKGRHADGLPGGGDPYADVGERGPGAI